MTDLIHRHLIKDHLVNLDIEITKLGGGICLFPEDEINANFLNVGYIKYTPQKCQFRIFGRRRDYFLRRGRARENLLTNFHFVEFCLLGYSAR
jgi:hypothetical protein